MIGDALENANVTESFDIKLLKDNELRTAMTMIHKSLLQMLPGLNPVFSEYVILKENFTVGCYLGTAIDIVRSSSVYRIAYTSRQYTGWVWRL